MCRVVCQNVRCGKVAVTTAIIRRGHGWYCSLKCVSENLGSQDDGRTGYAVERVPVAYKQNSALDDLPLFSHPPHPHHLVH